MNYLENYLWIEWSFNYNVFYEICFMFGKLNIDLFVFRLNNELLKYVFFLLDLIVFDVFNMKLNSNSLYYLFLLFSCIGRLF